MVVMVREESERIEEEEEEDAILNEMATLLSKEIFDKESFTD